MDHFELSSELGKVVQPLKKMGVDSAAQHHRQSKLNEVAEQMAWKEARCSDIASISGTDSNGTMAIPTVEASPARRHQRRCELTRRSLVYDTVYLTVSVPNVS